MKLERQMRDKKRNLIRKTLPIALLTVSLAPSAGIAADDSCPIKLDDIKSRISSLSTDVDKAEDNVENDFKSATSSDYAKKFFDTFNQLNQAAKDATALVNTSYNLAGYTSPLAEGKQQTKLPPKVTLTMSNAQQLAQAAADESKTKLDIAQLRCNQNTEDAALGAALGQMDSATVDKFKKAKKTACKIVHVAADLQDKKQKLDEIRTNGYPLFFLHAKDKKTFDGQYTRTIQFKLDLRMYPIYPDGVKAHDGSDPKDQQFLLGKIEGIRLSYNTWYKWSDNNWEKLNLYQYLISDTGKNDVCVPVFKATSSVSVNLCIKDVSMNSNKDALTIKTYSKFKYKGDSKSVSLPTVTVPAPFGYLADVSDMKEEKKKQLKDKVVNRLADVMGKHGDLVKKAQEWQEKCG